ncbi:MAG: ABC transporter ATP-binding protein [Actinobacteria bacterium]|jgi:branched-chain amino acid transport system ATP-binding protein|nr:ABC transporter ATP-binding protein [Actinomycetota bacterium]|tara:strand:- start:583 stop:1398 length:816 start_codon:yes stop_codon:yes gene_type:complete
MSNLLETKDLTVTFGGLNANDHVDIEISKGSFVGLIGPNGAGKTTFIDAITGFVPTSAGSAIFNGHNLSELKPHERAQLGLVRTFQSLELFEDLSVRDNLLVAAHPTSWYTLLLDVLRIGQSSEEMEKRIEWALEVAGLTGLEEELPTDLPHGQRKLVGVARALAAQPNLVLLDEPAAGLDTAESNALGGHLRGLLDHDVTVFLIDHDMGLVLSVCDYIYVMDFGKIIAAGTPEEVRTNPEVVAAYLGEEAGEAQARSAEELRGMSGTAGE